MLVIKLLSIIVILCAIILLIQLLQLCMMNKETNASELFSIEKFEEENPLDEEGGDGITAPSTSVNKQQVENVTRDLDDIELSTNNMLLKIQSLKNTLGSKKDPSPTSFKDFVAQRMKQMGEEAPEEAIDNVYEEDYEDMDGPMVEGFVDGLSHSCSSY